MSRGSFAAQSKIEIADSWFNGSDTSVNFLALRVNQMPSFVPEGFLCNTSSNATEQADGYAYVKGIMFGENANRVSTYRVPLGIPVGLAFSEIWRVGTTARGCKMLCEK